jgi:hypothetical protein
MSSNLLRAEYEKRLQGFPRHTPGSLPDFAYQRMIDEERASLAEQGLSPGRFGSKANGTLIDEMRKDDGGLQHLYDDLLKDLLDTIATNTLSSAPPTLSFDAERVIAGPFPIVDHSAEEFNAWALPTEHGVLILVNDLLSTFVYHLMKIFVLANDFHDLDIVKRLPADEAAIATADLVYSYLFRESLHVRLPNQGGHRGNLLEVLTYDILRYLIAHELGHVLASHIGVLPPFHDQPVKSAEQVNGAVKWYWGRERKADEIGLELMLPRSVLELRGRPALEGAMLAARRADGALMCLGVLDLLQSCLAEVRGSRTDEFRVTHPPVRIRLTTVASWIDQIGISRLTTNAQTFLAWIKVLLPGVTQRVRSRIEHDPRSADPNRVLFDLMNHSSEGLIMEIDHLQRAHSWEEAKAIIEARPILLTEEAEDALEKMAVVSKAFAGRLGPLGPDVDTDPKAAQQLYQLIRSCRRVGVEAAFQLLSRRRQ